MFVTAGNRSLTIFLGAEEVDEAEEHSLPEELSLPFSCLDITLEFILRYLWTVLRNVLLGLFCLLFLFLILLEQWFCCYAVPDSFCSPLDITAEQTNIATPFSLFPSISLSISFTISVVLYMFSVGYYYVIHYISSAVCSDGTI